MFDSFKFYGSATVGTKGQIVIPAEARDELKLKEGDKLIVVRNPRGCVMMLMKAETLEEMIEGMQTKLGMVIESARKLKKKGS